MLLHVRHVKFQLLFVKPRLTHVADDTGNSQPRIRRIGWSNFETFSDRVFAGPILFRRRRLTRVTGVIGRIVRFKIATAQERMRSSREVVGTHHTKQRKRQLHIARRRASLD